MPDYSNYSLEELIEARDSINEEKFPERAAEIDALIKEKSAEAGLSPDEVYSSTDKAEVSVEPLPLETIFIEALSSPFRQIKQLPKLLLPGFILALSLAYFYFFTADQYRDFAQEDGIGKLFLVLSPGLALFLLGFTLVVVTWHRIVLLGADAYKGIGLQDWLGIGVRFAGWCVVLGLCLLAVMIPYLFVISILFGGLTAAAMSTDSTGWVFGWGMLVNLLTSLYVYFFLGRWSLIFPAAAVGHRGRGLAWSWSLTHGNEWRMIAIVGIFPFLLNLSLSLFPDDTHIIVDILHGIVAFILFLVQISLLSLSYQFLTKEKAETAE